MTLGTRTLGWMATLWCIGTLAAVTSSTVQAQSVARMRQYFQYPKYADPTNPHHTNLRAQFSRLVRSYRNLMAVAVQRPGDLGALIRRSRAYTRAHGPYRNRLTRYRRWATENRTFVGRVLTRRNGRVVPLGGATITLQRGRTVLRERTAPSARFEFRPRPRQSVYYDFEITRRGYRSRSGRIMVGRWRLYKNFVLERAPRPRPAQVLAGRVIALTPPGLPIYRAHAQEALASHGASASTAEASGGTAGEDAISILPEICPPPPLEYTFPVVGADVTIIAIGEPGEELPEIAQITDTDGDGRWSAGRKKARRYEIFVRAEGYRERRMVVRHPDETPVEILMLADDFLLDPPPPPPLSLNLEAVSPGASLDDPFTD